MDALAVLAAYRSSHDDDNGGRLPTLSYQFERQGYFALDPIESDVLPKGGPLIFNRMVTLRDTWAITPTIQKPRHPTLAMAHPAVTVEMSVDTTIIFSHKGIA